MEKRLKALAKIPDLELMAEFEEMFKKTWEPDMKDIIGSHLAIRNAISQIHYGLGEVASLYCRFLDKVEQVTIFQIPDNEKLRYLYDINLSMGNVVMELVKLTLLSKMNNRDIHNGFTNLCNRYQSEYLVTEEHQLQTLTKFARFVNIQQQVYNNPEINLRPIVHYQAQAEFDLPVDEPFLLAGKIVNQSFLGLLHRYVFNVTMCTYELVRSLELDEMKLDNQVYSEKVLQLWLNLFAMLDGMGYDWNSIQRIYTVTLNINEEEVEDNG